MEYLFESWSIYPNRGRSFPKRKVPLSGHRSFVLQREKIMDRGTSNFSNLLLTGTIILANVNVSDLVDYCLKAFLGGAIWLGYKVTADYLERKRKNNERKQ